ncbi:hypothetical protein ColTof3_08938 [Colletotrichum tofieldiae]|nr:hypothetical protein ColTof3_08938 [Colletotrichum tofieldiae]
MSVCLAPFSLVPGGKP